MANVLKGSPFFNVAFEAVAFLWHPIREGRLFLMHCQVDLDHHPLQGIVQCSGNFLVCLFFK